MEDFKKWLISIGLGAWATFKEQYAIILIFVIGAIVFDVITGFLKCKSANIKINSTKGTQGFFKKIGLLVSFGFGIFLDLFIPYALEVGVSIDLPFNSPFALIIAVYIILNESISICENLYGHAPRERVS